MIRELLEKLTTVLFGRLMTFVLLVTPNLPFVNSRGLDGSSLVPPGSLQDQNSNGASFACTSRVQSQFQCCYAHLEIVSFHTESMLDRACAQV